MGKIWDILQVIFGLLLAWVLVDIATGFLWVAGFLGGLTLGGFLGPFAVIGYIIVVLVILQLIKALTAE
ncbi:MAG: hypothetical protein KAS63_07255 [Candidatus Heimdallarchaeota archaeon]|nr:hypothetical protein [Candidatus Heimdallarchaeota archaeon]MCK4955144.1 hypothetical protein [Candidatus Heimdallarchaeota archaeon]